jgi:uncharacterized peroxidase-related enzyme
MPLVRSLPENPTLADLRRLYSELFELLRPYAQQLMRGPSPLSIAQRELIAAYVSGINSCRFCLGTHARVADGFGIEASMVDALIQNLDDAPIEERLKPLLRYVRKLTELPARMTSSDADSVYAVGWSDAALVHAIAVCAYFNQMNRLVEGAGIVGAQEDYERGANKLVCDGYER